jgi:hypothetical protein
LVTTDSIDPNTKFESRRLVLALRKIDPHLGSSVVDSMVSWLKDLGLDLENEMNAFSLIEVEATLCKIFGERLARLLREDLEVALLNE